MGGAIGRIEILPDPLALAHHVAEWMTQAALAAQSSFRVSLSGGSTPKALYGLLASDEFLSRFPWPRVSWYWGDERFVPHDHPDSNYRMTREAMLAKVPVPPANIHPVPTDGTADDAARRYERTLQEVYGAATLDPQRPLFDVTLLGLGPDGHTASLVPGEPVLTERKRWVGAVSHGRPKVRITMTYPAIESSRRVAFLVAGKEKASIFGAIRAGDSQVPAARVRPVGELFWFVVKRQPAKTQAPRRTGRVRDDPGTSFHARSGAHQSARTDALDHQRALRCVGRFGVVLDPATPPELVEYVLHLCDVILVMTVNPGFGGQNFLPEMLPKIRRLREMCAERALHPVIEVDGGENATTAAQAAAAGATAIVAGSAIFGAKDYAKATAEIRARAAAAAVTS